MASTLEKKERFLEACLLHGNNVQINMWELVSTAAAGLHAGASLCAAMTTRDDPKFQNTTRGLAVVLTCISSGAAAAAHYQGTCNNLMTNLGLSLEIHPIPPCTEHKGNLWAVAAISGRSTRPISCSPPSSANTPHPTPLRLYSWLSATL